MAYILKCPCGFVRWSDGKPETTADLVPVILCAKCGGSKAFKCPGCGYVVKARQYREPPAPEKHHFGS